MSGSNPHEQKGVGSWCPHPLLIFNDCTFVLQILLCTPLRTDPYHTPLPIHLFTHLLGIGKMLRLLRLRILLRDHFCLHGFFCCYFFFFSFLFFFFGRGRKKRNRKGDNFLKMMLYCVLEKRSIYETLSLSDSLYDSASWCLPSSRQIANVTWQG